MFHTLIIAGNLGRDPEMRYTPSGQAVTTLSVATSRKWSQNGEMKEETVWFRVTAWGKLAETTNEYLRKGRQVLIEGRLNPDENGNPRVWTTNDGQPRASFEVTAQTVRFLGGRGETGGYRSDQDAPAGAANSEEDIPF